MCLLGKISFFFKNYETDDLDFQVHGDFIPTGSVKYFDVDGAQCHAVWNDEEYCLCFRGTEPKEMSDVKADLLAFKRKSKTEGRVHMGFKLELRKLWPDIEALLQRNKQKKLPNILRVKI